MAFWGIEVKPGKPYTHVHDGRRGALCVSQATLGNGTATNRTVVQCNVGKKSPVLLCSLLPDKVESCSLALHFEEEEEVVFSVVGPRSIHLTGYFLGESRHGSEDGDDSDSYGEDIWEMGSEDSGSYISEDDYESDFMDDGDVEMSPSPRPNSGVVIEEIIEDEKPANGIINDQHPEKKQGNDTEDGEDSPCQVIVKHNRSPILDSEDEDGFPISLSSGNKDNKKNIGDDKAFNADRKRKLDALPEICERKGKAATVNKQKSKKERKDKVKSLNSPETDISRSSEQIGNRPTEDQNKDADDRRDEAQPCQEEREKLDHVSENSGKLKKKKKERVKKEKPSEARATLVVDKSGEGASTDKTEATNNVELANPENSDTRSGQEGVSVKKDADSGAGSTIPEDLSKAKKKQKKNKKLHNNDPVTDKLDSRNEAARKPRTFPNGLVIEELSMGQPDGKRASPGKTVLVNYIGKLKNGKIFDSNVGQRPFKFRLGVGQVIKGWDVGVDGMRIGDKRRLTIPPSMGYGEKGAGGVIPGNAWLTFDVELVDVK